MLGYIRFSVQIIQDGPETQDGKSVAHDFQEHERKPSVQKPGSRDQCCVGESGGEY